MFFSYCLEIFLELLFSPQENCIEGIKEMVQLAKHLLYRQEDLSWDPQAPCRKWASMCT